MRHVLYLVYLCPCLGLGLFISYLCDRLLIFSLIFIVVNQNRRTVFKTSPIIYLILFLKVDEESEYFSSRKSSASGCCLAFAYFLANFSVALVINVLLIKKVCSKIRKVMLHEL